MVLRYYRPVTTTAYRSLAQPRQSSLPPPSPSPKDALSRRQDPRPTIKIHPLRLWFPKHCRTQQLHSRDACWGQRCGSHLCLLCLCTHPSYRWPCVDMLHYNICCRYGGERRTFSISTQTRSYFFGALIMALVASYHLFLGLCRFASNMLISEPNPHLPLGATALAHAHALTEPFPHLAQVHHSVTHACRPV